MDFEPSNFKPHEFDWIVGKLREEISYFEKPMFSCRACYCHGKLMLVLAANDDPEWRGLLVPTDREFHGSLKKDYTALVNHPVLGKWLYLPESEEDFERVAMQIADKASKNDSRIGVEPKPKKKRICNKWNN